LQEKLLKVEDEVFRLRSLNDESMVRIYNLETKI